MIARPPLIPTALVLAAACAMVALGIWQLGRAGWKADLIERHQRALAMTEEVAFPYTREDQSGALYRRSSLICRRVIESSAIAGRNARGAPGWAQTALCGTAGGEAMIALGWSRDPASVAWAGGKVAGVIVPAGEGVRLVAYPPLAGLQPLARPDPRDLPNNHLAYAVQWFVFAATALVIYGLALRKRNKSG